MLRNDEVLENPDGREGDAFWRRTIPETEPPVPAHLSGDAGTMIKLIRTQLLPHPLGIERTCQLQSSWRCFDQVIAT